jgi:lipopolysaccharide/colanic/teichoic acid biosynthesis glycosyltransferase
VKNIIWDAQAGMDRWRQLNDSKGKEIYEQQWNLFTGALLVVDAFVVGVSLTLAFVLRISSGIILYTANYEPSIYALLTAISIVLWLGLFALHGLYKRDNLLGGSIEYQQVIKACTTGVVVLIVLSFFSHDLVNMVVSRSWLFLSWALTSLLVVGERFLARRVAYFLRRQGWFTARVLIVGANEQGLAMAQQWLNSQTSGMQVVGFVDDFKPVGTVVLNGIKVVGRPTALTELVQRLRVSEVVVVPSAVAWETFEEIIEQSAKPKDYFLRLSPGFYGLLSTSVAVTNKTFVPLFSINETRIVGMDAHLKSFVDLSVSTFIALITLPVSLLIAAVLKLERPDERVLAPYHTAGQSGVMFDMLKFNIPICEHDEPAAAKPGLFDRIIYAKGLDKLPQLLNVLRGQMSLVGPRPAVFSGDEVDQRTETMLRAVKPGVLGPWLVREFWTSGEDTQDELYYVRNWTIWLDIQILIQAGLTWLRSRRSTPSQTPPAPPAHKQDRPLPIAKLPFNSSTMPGNNALPFTNSRRTSTALMSTRSNDLTQRRR